MSLLISLVERAVVALETIAIAATSLTKPPDQPAPYVPDM